MKILRMKIKVSGNNPTVHTTAVAFEDGLTVADPTGFLILLF